MEETEEQEFLSRVAEEGSGAWEAFLEAYAGLIFRVVALFADSYDERMDLFLFVCARLREGEMKRVRAFRYRPDAPCRLSTYLSVVVKNIAVDYLRSREGRFRPFRRLAELDETDRLLFEYHVRDGRSLEEARSLLRGRHGIRVSAAQAAERASRVSASLTASQRWRLLARLATKRRSLSIDPVADVAIGSAGPLPLESDRGDPERRLHLREARQTFLEAMATIPPRQRLALTLRFRDGLAPAEIARILAVSPPEAERLTREGLDGIRERLKESGVARLDLESAGASSLWTP